MKRKNYFDCIYLFHFICQYIYHIDVIFLRKIDVTDLKKLFWQYILKLNVVSM